MEGTADTRRERRKRAGIRLAAFAVLALMAGCGRAENSLLLLEELPRVSSISIEGNHRFSDGTLKKLMTTQEGAWWNPFRESRYRKSQLEADIGAILTFYRRRGYLRAEVSSQEIHRSGDTVRIVIQVTEGEPVTVSDVGIVGAGTIDRGFLADRVSLKPGHPFDPFRVQDDERSLLDALADRGYWEAKVRGEVQFFDDRAVVLYAVDEGEPVRVSQVDVTWGGPQKMGERVVRQDISVKPGDLLRLSQLDRSQLRLLQSGYFADARWDTTALDTVDHTVGVDFRVRERKLRWWEVGIGISSEQEIRLTGEWGTRNLLNSGMRYSIGNQTDFDLTGRLKHNLGLDLIQNQMLLNRRHLLGSLWEGQTTLTQIHDPEVVVATGAEYIQNTVALGVSVRRNFGDLRNQIILSLENRWVVNDADSVARANDVALYRDSYQTRLLSAWVERGTRNDLFNPTRGMYENALFQFAGGALGGNNGFVKGVSGITRIQPLHVGSWILAGRIQAGYVKPTSDASTLAGRPVTNRVELIPNEDRFYLGGASSVRGYEQNGLDGTTPADTSSNRPAGGLATFLANLELRFPLKGSLSGVGFLDAGNVWQSWDRLERTHFFPQGSDMGVGPEDLRYSYGLGLRFATPLGPVRFDYAWRWNVPEGDHDKKERWHVAIGQAF